MTWAAIDDKRARATLRIGQREVAAVFEFGEDGLPLRVSAERYRFENGKGTPILRFLLEELEYEVSAPLAPRRCGS